MQRDIYSEFASRSSANLSAQSEWVITFPTKHLHLRQAQPARLPFRSSYNIANGGACEIVQTAFWDREGAAPRGDGGIPLPLAPQAPAPTVLCRSGGDVQSDQHR